MAIEEKTAPKVDTGKVIAVGTGVALIGGGLYYALKKPPAIYLGDKVTLSKVSFTYTGPERQLFICWGLKKGSGDFNNGANLAGGLWTWGGPMEVEAVAGKKYSFTPKKDFETQPVLYLDPDAIEAKNYDTYIWITFGEATTDEDFILAIDTDADAVKIKV
ncbi:MAG TPA: hypothetical protein VMW64_00790 [Dehalococcoidia bacterium]|nr:hypothetical protein [Dehalococcoidia bacterium]